MIFYGTLFTAQEPWPLSISTPHISVVHFLRDVYIHHKIRVTIPWLLSALVQIPVHREEITLLFIYHNTITIKISLSSVCSKWYLLSIIQQREFKCSYTQCSDSKYPYKIGVFTIYMYIIWNVIKSFDTHTKKKYYFIFRNHLWRCGLRPDLLRQENVELFMGPAWEQERSSHTSATRWWDG